MRKNPSKSGLRTIRDITSISVPKNLCLGQKYLCGLVETDKGLDFPHLLSSMEESCIVSVDNDCDVTQH